ncbi:helicase-exonuclease AddAB subunit AddA [Nicoliella spurrieriana]|uniref:ATP-dependent helicase/nuclease subunit A n=1 Tax=Nicoliella spurrieriana TaxID=2925830 RepID=A0A976X5Z9_9LACO|nr:helicase-exonuclease AddAB subunit AddA [Nicoliella spurrieriana]UQS87194.1 helicase-exonuclease AddAB subunit AddA [Nicoliella spurrieriana]
MDYTKAQSAAVYGKFNGNVLVSASAGSGKTRVLVDRVINKLIHFESIDQMLIVTFTRAAAKEMKDRILSALQAQLSKAKDAKLRTHLTLQIRKLPVADISTLDSFCQKVVQRNYYVINLDPDFRILTDRTETAMLRDLVWETVRENYYANDQDGSFAQLTENFSNDRSDDGLTDLVYRLYDYANVNRDPKEWLNQLTKQYQVGDSIVQSPFYRQYLKPTLVDQLNQVRLNFQAALDYANEQQLAKEAALEASEVELIDHLIRLLDTEQWDAIRDAMNVNFKSFPRGSKNDDELVKTAHNHVKDLRDAGKNQFRDQILSNYFVNDEQRNVAIMDASAKIIDKLVEVVGAFSDHYRELKRNRHVMEFIDIEHAALDIFNQNTGKANVQMDLQRQYNEIMVDEYQDNNRLQDAILTTIARRDEDTGETNNMFMVGDVKQSIYRFRLAAPEMFLERMKKYQVIDNDDQTILLKENFRSMANVDHFVNLIFNQVMSNQVGKIEYQGANNLVAGANYYPNELESKVTVMLYRNQDVTDSNDEQSEPVNERFQVDDSAHGQIELIAQKILELKRKQQRVYDRHEGKMRELRYSDIALISATRNNNLVISDVFAQHNLPVTINGAQSYFKTTEIQIMMALLSIIDNPYQDIPLVAVLRSPIVGLNENQLAYLRINSNTGEYYQAVTNFVRNYPHQDSTEFGDQVYARVGRFLDQLSQFRDTAQQNELVTLIWQIYEVTGFLDYVGGMPAGKQRQANLHALYDRAAQYEKSSFKGLFQFVRFIDKMQSGDNDLAEPAANPDDNTITVTTIHGSKGLEYPIVFLVDANHQFNMQDSKGEYVLDDDLGLGITYFNDQRREKVATLQKQVVQNRIDNDTLDEEMRKLYVALTRTEQQLFIVGAIKDIKKTDADILDEWGHKAMQSDQLLLTPALRRSAKSYLDWILPAVARHPKLQAQFTGTTALTALDSDTTNISLRFYHPVDLQEHAPEQPVDDDHEFIDHLNATVAAGLDVDNANQIQRIMDYQYPNQAATTTTAYQAVSEVKRAFDDPDALEMGRIDGISEDTKQTNRYVANDFAEPEFLQTISQPQPTEIGTATHLVLQQLDLTQPPTLATVNALIDQLVTDRIIAERVAAKIDCQAIVNFFSSELGALVLKHPDRVRREAPFSLIMSASQLFKGFNSAANEKILIHGIIDGYLVLDDAVYLFDYKTDYVGKRNVEQHVQRIVDKYRGQVNLYGLALEKILGRPVRKRFLYLLAIGKLVPIHEHND